ncbi:hypothetical protein OAB20_00005, partial [Winogradskyella sp.]|nr:hypothetical protein [Winogradskyella sp.]
LKMKQDIVRLPVTEMGCAAGVSGILYAKNFLKANPNKRAVVIAVEAPTATFQLEDYSMVNIVSAAIFGDGCASVILSPWERGANENLNGLIRQYFPKKSDFSLISDQEIKRIETKLNNRPRKRFNFDTPLEMMDKLLFNTEVAFIT